jgi:hypothetical protein
MILAIWRQETGKLERVVVQSPLTRKEIMDSLVNGDRLEFEAGTDLDFGRMEREWRARHESHWV